MGACYAADSSDEAAGPILLARPRDRLEGSAMVSDEICRIMRRLREIEREMVRCRVRPDLANRLQDIIEQLGDLDIEIEFFESDSE